MTQVELSSLYFDALTIANANFEFWITISFALIVAFQFVGQLISRNLKIAILSLYFFSSFVFWMRFNNAGMIVQQAVDQLESSGIEIDFAMWGGPSAGPLINVIIMVGTFVAIYYASKTSSSGT